MSFEHIKDQISAVRLMRNILRKGRIPNGLLFWGPKGVGKFSTAMELAKALNCSDREDDACDTCLSCRKVAHGNHPDVKIIAPSGKSRIINVETIDTITEMTIYRPFEATWRLIILEDVDRMRLEAQNHFLKTLEEPPSNTIFVLITEFPRALLPTIRSRCQQVRFGSLQAETVSNLLQQHHELDSMQADTIAALSQGQMSRALDLLDSSKHKIVLDFANRLATGEDPLLLSAEFDQYLAARAETIRNTVKETSISSEEQQQLTKEEKAAQNEEIMAAAEGLIKQEIMEYLRLFQLWYRDLWVFQVTGDTTQVLYREQIKTVSHPNDADLEAKIASLDKAWIYLERNLRRDRVIRDLFFSLAS